MSEEQAVHQVIKYQDFFKVITLSEGDKVGPEVISYMEDLIADLGQVKLNNDLTLGQVLQTAKQLVEDWPQWQENMKVIVNDQENKKKIYLSYLEVAQKSGEYADEDIEAARKLIEPQDQPAPPDVSLKEAKLRDKGTEPQLNGGFGYNKDTQRWFILEQIKQGVTRPDLINKMQAKNWEVDDGQARVLIANIRKDMSRNKLEETIVSENGVYKVVPISEAKVKKKKGGRRIKAKQDRSDPANVIIDALKSAGEVDFHVEITPEEITVTVEGVIRMKRDSLSEKAVAPILLHQEFGGFENI